MSATRAARPGATAPGAFSRLGTRTAAFDILAIPGGRLREAWLSIPVWARILVIYVLGRVLSTILLLQFAAHEDRTWQTSARPGLVEFSNIWDGQWYRRVAEDGYPSELPHDADGHVTESAWAFMPAFPYLIRLLAFATGLGFEPLAILVSLAAGVGTAYATHRLFRHVVDPSAAMFGVLLVCIMPTSPLFQLGYAESLQLCLLAVLLCLLVERRWMMMVPVVVLASFTRPTGLAWALTLVVYLGLRWLAARRGGEPFPRTEQLDVVIVTIVSVLAGFGWPFVAWVVTGQPGAYFDTEFAWRSRYTGWDAPHGPFLGWFQGAQFWVDFATNRALPPATRDLVTWGAGALAVVALFLVAFALLASRRSRRLGPEIRIWLFSYLLYLFAVFFPQSSTFRILTPLFPALALLAVPKSPVWRVLVVVLSVLGQLAWLQACWYVDGADWSPP